MAVWDDTRLKPHVRAAAKELSERFSITNIGGFATSGHIAGSDHYTGHALDLMTLSDTAKGQAIATYAVTNAERLAVKYVIWNRAIWDARDHRGWERYVGSSPHTDHVHISFLPEGTLTLDDVSKGTAGSSLPNGCMAIFTSLFGNQKGS